MPTVLENLTTARENIAARLAEITASPKPSYEEAGRVMDWNEYQEFLLNAIVKLNGQIDYFGGEPSEIEHYGLI